ncbi:TRAP transporter small permease [Paracoccus sp. (in: a-proteobacteria)]|uniref:TRAP transporter small permease n=1 Tax=Paracoccus sp. TaxID=267 RepID=UPI003A89F024
MAWREYAAAAVNGLNHMAALACHVLLVIITGVTVLQVFLRYFLNNPTSWSEEIALLCLIWFGLLAVAVGIRRHEHVAITFLRDLLPARMASALDYLAQLAVGGFMFVVMFYGNDLIALAGVQVLPASRLPKSLLYLPTIIGGTLGMLNAAANIILHDVHFAPHETMEATDGR